MKLQELVQKPNFIELVETELRRLAKEKPDFIYNPSGKNVGCSYTGAATNGPECDGCIFGQAFQRLGVDREDLKECTLVISHELRARGFESPKIWLTIQGNQDTGKSWGEAIKHLDN